MNDNTPTPLPQLPRPELRYSLSAGEIASLVRSTREFKRGEELSWNGADGMTVYVVQTGVFKIIADNPGGRETILTIIGPGELFGQMPLLENDTRACRAVAMEDGTVGEFPSGDAESLMASHGEIAMRLTRMFGNRLRKIETRMSHLLFKDARQRVAFILLDLMQDWAAPHAKCGTMLNVRVTHQDLANLTGLTRETVSVTLAEFELDEHIATQGRRIIVTDANRLREIMAGTTAN